MTVDDEKLNHMFLVLRLIIAISVVFVSLVGVTAFVTEHNIEGRLRELEQRLIRMEARQVLLAEKFNRGVNKDEKFNWSIGP